jgi:hypothetical protein
LLAITAALVSLGAYVFHVLEEISWAFPVLSVIILRLIVVKLNKFEVLKAEEGLWLKTTFINNLRIIILL